MFQRQSDVLSAWRSSVMQVSLLFIVTLFVLILLGGAFHWQASKAAEADSILGVATARLDKALDRGQCGMWDWDVNKGIIFWSRSMFEILGMPVKGDYLSFAEVLSRIHENDTQLEEAVEQLLDGKITSFDQEFRMRHQDGHFVWLRARVALAPGETEDQPHLIGIVFDITQQKLADKLNKEAELRLMDAVENISEAFVLWDADNRLVLCNSKYQQFHSLPASVCAPGTAYEDVVRTGQGAGSQKAHRLERREWRRPFLRGAARRPALAADQRAAHQGWGLRLRGHRHHRAEAAGGAPEAFRARTDDDGARPAEGTTAG